MDAEEELGCRRCFEVAVPFCVELGSLVVESLVLLVFGRPAMYIYASDECLLIISIQI